MQFKITFIGRLAGAIGITYRIVETVEAENDKKAVLKLYEKFEHIHVLSIEKKGGN